MCLSSKTEIQVAGGSGETKRTSLVKIEILTRTCHVYKIVDKPRRRKVDTDNKDKRRHLGDNNNTSDMIAKLKMTQHTTLYS